VKWRWFEGGKGPVMVLLPGFAASPKTLLRLGRQLAVHFRVLLPQIPGFDLEAPLSLPEYRLNRQVERLDRWFEAMKLKGVLLGGNSAGGQLAALYALQFPEKVNQLILLAPQGAGDDRFHPYDQKTQYPHSQKDLVQELSQLYACPPAFTGEAMNRLIQEKQKNWDFLNQIRLSIQLEPSHRINDLLPGLKVPALLIWGTQDGRLPVRLAEVWRGATGLVEAHLLDHCGHMPQIEQTATCVQLITAFCEAHSSSPREA